MIYPLPVKRIQPNLLGPESTLWTCNQVILCLITGLGWFHGINWFGLIIESKVGRTGFTHLIYVVTSDDKEQNNCNFQLIQVIQIQELIFTYKSSCLQLFYKSLIGPLRVTIRVLGMRDKNSRTSWRWIKLWTIFHFSFLHLFILGSRFLIIVL